MNGCMGQSDLTCLISIFFHGLTHTSVHKFFVDQNFIVLHTPLTSVGHDDGRELDGVVVGGFLGGRGKEGWWQANGMEKGKE